MAARSSRPKRKPKPNDRFKHSRKTAGGRQRRIKIEDFKSLDDYKLEYEEA